MLHPKWSSHGNDISYKIMFLGSRKLENYKSKDDLLAAVEGVDAMIIRSDIVDAAVLEKAKQLKIVVRAGAGGWAANVGHSFRSLMSFENLKDHDHHKIS